MARFVLHTTDLSPFGQRAKLAFRCKGLMDQLELVDTFGGTDALAALAPMAQIPLLETDGMALPESQTIVDYLDILHPDPPLLPSHPKRAALNRLVTRLVDLNIGPHFLTLISAMRTPDQKDAIQSAVMAFYRGFGFVEHYFDQAELGTGDLQMADLALAPFAILAPHLADWHGVPVFPDLPKMAGYLNTVQRAPHMAETFTEIETGYKARADRLRAT
ncbi:MAG: glutathione S-transferase family protein [Pseudomonadota bacterium]